MNYPHRSDAETEALAKLPGTPYETDDKPFVSTSRYCLSSHYEPYFVDFKDAVDNQGKQDNLYWFNQTRQQRVENGMEAV